jgi:hypothetical protein
MANIGIMIEGQEGLTWDRWRRLCHDVEEFHCASLRRSDHLMDRDALEQLATVSRAIAQR